MNVTVSYDVLSRDNYCLPGFAFLMIITRFRFLVTVFSKAQQMNIHKNADITIHNTFMRCKKVACHFEINRNLKTLINSGTFWLVFMLDHVLFRNGHLSYEQMSCCLSCKINTSEKNQNEIFWLINFTLSKRSVKPMKLLLCRGCPALYSSVEKLTF